MFNIPTVTVAKTTLTGTSSSVTLTYVAPSVAWTPRHLVVRVNGKTDRTGNSRDEVNVKFNGDTGTNYNYQALYGYASSSEAARYSGVAGLNVGWIATDNTASTVFGSMETLVPDALSTRSHKSTVSFVGAAEDGVVVSGGRWASTAAITSVTMSPVNGTNFNAGSTFELCVVDESFNIDEQILGSAGTFTVSSIGASNGDLVCIGNMRSAASVYNDVVDIAINGDSTTSNYACQIIDGTGTTVQAALVARPDFGLVSGDSSASGSFGGFIGQITNFADGSNDRAWNSLVNSHGSSSVGSLRVNSGRWNNTSAITSILLDSNNGSNLLAGSMLSTYAVPKNLIARQENTGSAGITFSDIPQTYDHLEVSCYVRDARTAGSDSLLITLNDDTTVANYDRQALYGSGSGVTANQSAADNTIGNIPDANHTANAFGATTVTIYNYTKTDRHKHILSVSGEDAFNYAGIHSLRWENTAAVTKLLINGGNGDLVSGSVIELRGISADTTAAAPSDVAALNGIASADIAAVN
jgi:hypothetical protein